MAEIYDLIVIGGGPGGYLGAERAAQAGMKVLLFEKRALGGVCLNEGCIPSKALLNSAKLYEHARNSAAYGVSCGDVKIDQAAVIARRGRVVRGAGIGRSRKMKAAGVTVAMQEARIEGRTAAGFIVRSDGAESIGRRLMIATAPPRWFRRFRACAKTLATLY